MNLIENIYDAYMQAISEKRKLSNCYFNSKDFSHWYDKREIIAYGDSENLILSVPEVGYRKIYFLANNWKWEKDISRLDLGRGQKAIEIIGWEELGEYDLSRRIKCKKILNYVRLRMTKASEIDMNLEKVDYCRMEDISRLKNLIKETFDPVGAYLPENEELMFLIENSAIICIRNTDEEVVGFLIFEDKAKTTYVRMVCICQKYRGQGMGKRLLLTYLNMHKDFKNFTLWCRTDNKAALKLYTDVGGYCCENFYNYVFVF